MGTCNPAITATSPIRTRAHVPSLQAGCDVRPVPLPVRGTR